MEQFLKEILGWVNKCTVLFQHEIDFLKHANFNVQTQNHLEQLKLLYIAIKTMFFNVVNIKTFSSKQ